MSGAPSVGIAVVSYNSSAPLAKLLASLEGAGHRRLVVWDNASLPGELAATQALLADAPGAELHESQANLGFGAGANRAIALLQEGGALDYAWLLNPDVVVRPDALAALVRSAERNGADLLSPLILDGDGRIWFAGGRLMLRRGSSVHEGIGQSADGLVGGFRTVSFVTGAAPLIRLSAWESLGGFDESYFLYCEDAELSLRAADAGMTLGIERDAVVVHDAGGSSGGGQSPTFSYYMQRNRLRLYRPHSMRLNLLLGSGFGEELRMLLVPFRDRGFGGFRNLAASLRGIADGWRQRTGPA